MKCLLKSRELAAASCNSVEDRMTRSEPGFLLSQHFTKRGSFGWKNILEHVSYTNFTSLYVLKSEVFTFSYTAKSFVFSGKSSDF